MLGEEKKNDNKKKPFNTPLSKKKKKKLRKFLGDSPPRKNKYPPCRFKAFPPAAPSRYLVGSRSVPRPPPAEALPRALPQRGALVVLGLPTKGVVGVGDPGIRKHGFQEKWIRQYINV